MKKAKIDLQRGPLLSQMVRYALPVLLASLLQQLFNAADVILASHLGTSGNDAVAAVGSTTALTTLMINFFIGCSTGSAVTVSRAFGSRNSKAIEASIHTAMLLSFVLGCFLTVLGVTLSGTLLSMLNTPQQIIGLSTVYLQMRFWGMIPHMVYNFGAAILRAVGETKKPLYFLLISGPLKLIFTTLFVSVLHLDVTGLALATTCSQLVSAVLVVASLIRRTDNCKLCLKKLKFSAVPLKKILRLGIPSGIQSATFSLSNVFIQHAVNSLAYLDGFITGDAAACSITNFADTLTGTFYQISLTFTGHNAGARNYDRVKRVYITAAGLSCLTIGVTSILVCLFPGQLLGLYISDDPQAIRWGTVRLLFVFAPLFLQGLMDVTSGCLRGMEVSFSTMIVTLLGVCGIRTLWTLTIFQVPQLHTPQVLYLCYSVSWAVTFFAELVLYIVIYKKRKIEHDLITAAD